MIKEIRIGPYVLYSFQLLICLGFLCAILIFLLQLKKDKSMSSRINQFLCLFPFLILGGFGGAILADKIAHFKETKLFELAGISFCGGILSGIAMYFVFYPIIVSKNKLWLIQDLNKLVCPIVIAHCFGRIGCFLAGCCYGKPSQSFLAVTFPANSLQHQQYGFITPVLPTQLFEALFLLILFLVLFFYIKNNKFSIYMISYGIFRFFLEFFRGDNRGSYFILLSPSQVYSILFIFIGIIFFYFTRNLFKLKGRLIQ